MFDNNISYKMNYQIFFLIIVVIVIIYYLSGKSQSNDEKLYESNENSKSNNLVTQNLINDYLNENECNENFDTMGSNVNMGNDMDFEQQVMPNPSQLSKSLKKSLVPDFEPNSLNINSDLNSYGYATTNSEADKYYEKRGFMDPKDGSKFADSVSYMLAHPYQTRYCKK